MAFPSITAFKENLLDGGARPSLFEMQLKWPGLVPAGPDAERLLQFHCRISEIPGTSHNPIVVKYAGREIKYAGQRVFNNLTVTILNDEGFTVRRSLETWFEAINSSETNVASVSSPTQAGYGGTGTVIQYRKTGSGAAGAGRARAYTFVDIFPVTLSPIALDWTNDGAIEDYTCEFAYQYWTAAD